MRAVAQSAKIEARAVFVPNKAPWLSAFQKEVLQFPRGKHDDQVDSMVQYLGWSKQWSDIDFLRDSFVAELKSASAPWDYSGFAYGLGSDDDPYT
jgi:hypothetical protein